MPIKPEQWAEESWVLANTTGTISLDSMESGGGPPTADHCTGLLPPFKLVKGRGSRVQQDPARIKTGETDPGHKHPLLPKMKTHFGLQTLY